MPGHENRSKPACSPIPQSAIRYKKRSNPPFPYRQGGPAPHNGPATSRHSMSDTTFDYIVIGGGTAGALLCNRLSAGGRHRVLLVEAGRKDDYHWIHIPVGYLYCIGNPRTGSTRPSPSRASTAAACATRAARRWAAAAASTA